MSKLIRIIFPVLFLTVVSSCSVFEATTKTSTKAPEENLANYRPTYSAPADSVIRNTTRPEKNFSGPTAKDLNADIDSMLVQLADNNRKYTKAPGYRIQVYTGGSRSEANRAKELIYTKHPDASIHMEYKQPNYTIRVGNYLDRINAQPLYVSLKKDFSNVLVVPDNIEITDKLFEKQ